MNLFIILSILIVFFNLLKIKNILKIKNNLNLVCYSEKGNLKHFSFLYNIIPLGMKKKLNFVLNVVSFFKINTTQKIIGFKINVVSLLLHYFFNTIIFWKWFIHLIKVGHHVKSVLSSHCLQLLERRVSDNCIQQTKYFFFLHIFLFSFSFLR